MHFLAYHFQVIRFIESGTSRRQQLVTLKIPLFSSPSVRNVTDTRHFFFALQKFRTANRNHASVWRSSSDGSIVCPVAIKGPCYLTDISQTRHGGYEQNIDVFSFRDAS